MRNILLAVALIGCGTDHIHTIDNNAVYGDNYACTVNAVQADGALRSAEDFQADLEACAMFHNICIQGTNDGTTCR